MSDFTIIDDGGFSVAQADGTPRFRQPFDGDAEFYILEEDYVQFYDSFVALALNTAHPAYLDFYLVKETDLQPVGCGGVVKWTRIFAKIPATRSDPTSIAYNFIGFYGTVANIAGLATLPIIGRSRFSATVNCRIQFDYFLIGTSGSYATADLIPVIRETKYYIPAGSLVSGVFTPTYTPGSENDLNNGLPTDNIYNAADWGNLVPCIPTRTTYQSWVTAKTEIVAEASHVSRWMGNIYARETKYIIAK